LFKVGDQTAHEEIKNSVIEFIRRNEHKFENFVSGEIGEEPLDVPGYLERLEHRGVWGGEIELEALSQFLKYSIIRIFLTHLNI